MSGPMIPPLDDAVAAVAAAASYELVDSPRGTTDADRAEAESRLDSLDLYAVRLNSQGFPEAGHVSHSSHASHSSHSSGSTHFSHGSHFSGSPTHHSGSQPTPAPTRRPLVNPTPTESPTPSATPTPTPTPTPIAPTPTATPTESTAVKPDSSGKHHKATDNSSVWAWLVSIGWIGLIVVGYRRWRATRPGT